MTFGVGSGDGTVETVMISAVEDTAVEGDHEFTVSIQSTTPPARVGLSSVVATIMDNDCKFTVSYKVGIILNWKLVTYSFLIQSHLLLSSFMYLSPQS